MDNIIVIGLGKSGLSILDYYFNTNVFIQAFDSNKNTPLTKIEKYSNCNNITIHLGTMPTGEEDVSTVFLSPIVSPEQDFVQKFLARDVKVTGEIQLAYDISKRANFIGITGTNGKTTTTSLLGDIYKLYDENSYIVGNIGNVALDSVKNAKENSNFITELSSFQLETITDFRPHIATILNITPDHLERHKTFENYKKAKYNIAKNQTKEDYLVINKDDDAISLENMDIKSNIIYFSMKQKLSDGVYYDEATGDIISTLNNSKNTVINKKDINLLGEHNIENVLACVAVAILDNIPLDIIKSAIKGFIAVKHRLQLVKTINSVSYVNDSKGTNVDSSIKAIQAIQTPIILIAGGYDKHIEFDDMIKSFDSKVKSLLLFGETKNQIKDTALKYGFSDIVLFDNLKQCVEYAHNISNPNDTVLLSPACASWDMYSSYEQRGDEFINLVNSINP